MKIPQRIKAQPAIFWYSVIASLSLILVTAFQWSLIDRLTGFLFIPLQSGLHLAFIMVSAWAAIYLILNRAHWKKASLSLLICGVGFCLVTFCPFTKLWITGNFVLHQKSREQIVQQVLSGALQPNVSYNASLIQLNSTEPYVSMGGNEIVVEKHADKTFILFFTFRGILDNFSGFLFVPEGGNPAQFTDLENSDNTEIEKFDKNWFFVSHH